MRLEGGEDAMKEFFYTFEMDGSNVGFSYLRKSSQRLLSLTKFRTPGMSLYTNLFDLRLSAGRVIAVKQGHAQWVDLSHLPFDHYPSAAYPLLLHKVGSEPFFYTQISEVDGSPIAVMTLTRVGSCVLESAGKTVRRRFLMEDEVPVQVDWGGPISRLCTNASEATRGSGVRFEAVA